MNPSLRQPSPEDREVLQNSKDGRSVKQAAMAFAKSQQEADHQFLGERLAIADLVNRLDPPENVSGSFQHLRLTKVMRGLMENSRPSAQQAILALTGTAPFQDHYLRIQILIRALAVIRPSPPAAVQYWERYSKPGSLVIYDVIEALCLNQSAPALALLETRCAQSGFTEDEKRVWMRESILVRRYDDPLIASCERILQGTMEMTLKVSLVEVLFDYRPKEWFIECAPPKPAELATASRPARGILLRIAHHAQETLNLPDQLSGRVLSTREVLEQSH